MNSHITNLTTSVAQLGLDVRDGRSNSVARATATENSSSSSSSSSLDLLASSIAGSRVNKRHQQKSEPEFDGEKIINSTLPKMPQYLTVVPYIDKNPDPTKRKIIPPEMNIILVSPMHQQYDEASTMALKMLVETRFEEEKFFRYQDPTNGPMKAPVNISTLYEDTLIWPIKASAIFWAASIQSASRYLQECFGALRYTEGGRTKSVSVLEAFHGPMHVLLNSGFAGSLLSLMVDKGANNPTLCLANLNGPVSDPTVSASVSLATSLNIPVSLWQDDTQIGYGGAANPLLMGLGGNQTVYHGYLSSSNPLRMYQGLGDFRWVGRGGMDNPCELDKKTGNYYVKGSKKPCSQGNAFDMTYEMNASTYSYMGTPANPVQGVLQEKSGQVLISPTLLDRLKESIWYGLGNPQATMGFNSLINPPISRACDTATCSKPLTPGSGLSLPFSSRYGRLLALGGGLRSIRIDGKGLTDVYEDLGKDRDHTKRTWSLHLAQAQWKFVIQFIKNTVKIAGGNLYGVLLEYFDPRDVPDMAFLFQFIAKGGVYDPDMDKFTADYIEPVPIRD